MNIKRRRTLPDSWDRVHRDRVDRVASSGSGSCSCQRFPASAAVAVARHGCYCSIHDSAADCCRDTLAAGCAVCRCNWWCFAWIFCDTILHVIRQMCVRVLITLAEYNAVKCVSRARMCLVCILASFYSYKKKHKTQREEIHGSCIR